MTKLALLLITTGALTLGMAASADQTSSSEDVQNNQVLIQTSTSVDISKQIEEIQNADAQQRVELMNQLKERIASMSPDQRRSTMQQLHTQMRHENGNEHAKDQKVMQKVEEILSTMQEHKVQIQEHAHEMQQNAHMEMEHNEHMNQREAGEQFKEQMHGEVTKHTEHPASQMQGPMGNHH